MGAMAANGNGDLPGCSQIDSFDGKSPATVEFDMDLGSPFARGIPVGQDNVFHILDPTTSVY